MVLTAVNSNEELQMTYTVNDVAKLTGLTPYTIRYYAKEGLLPLVERDANGTRLFKEEDLETLNMIECLKSCGMSIKEIREFTQWTLEGDSTIDQRLDLFKEKQKVLEERLRELTETLDVIHYKQWYYTVAKEAGTVGIHDSMKQEDIPEDMRRIQHRLAESARKKNPGKI